MQRRLRDFQHADEGSPSKRRRHRRRDRRYTFPEQATDRAGCSTERDTNPERISLRQPIERHLAHRELKHQGHNNHDAPKQLQAAEKRKMCVPV